MRKLIVLFCFFIVVFSSFAQNKYDSIGEPRIQVIKNDKTADISGRFLVLENDILYPYSNNSADLNFLLPDNYDYNRMLGYYQRVVYCYLTDNPPIVYQLMQWSVPIVIYMDKDIPKDVQDDFKNFISKLQMDNIKHLDISFTKRFKNSNYHIKSTETAVNGYDKNYEFDSEEDRLNDLLTGSTYKLVTDGNNKFYGGVLQIHLKSFQTNDDVTKRLKQLFYKSLGNFVADNYIETNSLLHNDYDNSAEILDFDLNILKIHYSLIYDQRIYLADFRNLLTWAQRQK
ncbi:hypothetical protein [Bizionia myxarmorum]|uniref:DUF2927 domain-containing protein n=1 Tax=Bizionia myxarmorum TaxID=291186 RepID=A0A5D0R4P1_9FLAO|nr:hypothetical protein [Bizionia myxarmorum]TYB76393.1 hypothetical protein ES674_12470 [Bizionia myxarmorum]